MFPLKCEYVAFSRIISDKRLDVLETGQVGLKLERIDRNSTNRCPITCFRLKRRKRTLLAKQLTER